MLDREGPPACTTRHRTPLALAAALVVARPYLPPPVVGGIS